MDNFNAVMLGMSGRANKNDSKYIDWIKVFETIKENSIENAEVGLADDFDEFESAMFKLAFINMKDSFEIESIEDIFKIQKTLTDQGGRVGKTRK